MSAFDKTELAEYDDDMETKVLSHMGSNPNTLRQYPPVCNPPLYMYMSYLLNQ